mmetsp:Transcript_33672/g.54808  ORF Transcript_33672/g.54808 Transcript_33672/m.54808 type:complete len:461 (-) Transcript_33672:68-1450(-)
MGCCHSAGVAYIQQENSDRNNHNVARSSSLSADSGVFQSSAPSNARDHSKAIDRHLAMDQRRLAKVKKLLLLGAGSSGKSTLFKQLHVIYHSGMKRDVLDDAKSLIRENCVEGIFKLCAKTEWLYELDNVAHKDCFIDVKNQSDELVAQIMFHINEINRCTRWQMSSTTSKSFEHLSAEQCHTLCASIKFLWAQPQIKNTFAKRQYFSFKENMDYFFDRLDVVFSPDYYPSVEDALKCRHRTTGSTSERFTINNVHFDIYDAGGQQSERKKWIKIFDGVTAVIFVAALPHYCAVLFENERKNAMHESLELFSEIINSRWFRKTEMILFLNKNDLFRRRLKEGISLSVAFGENWEGEKWEGPEYTPRRVSDDTDLEDNKLAENEEDDEDDEDDDKDDEELNTLHDQGLVFIRRQYEHVKKDANKKIYVHFTTATNQENVANVFWDVQNIIVSGNMKTTGLG